MRVLKIITKNADNLYMAECYQGSYCDEELGASPDEAVGALMRHLELSETFKEPVQLIFDYQHK